MVETEVIEYGAWGRAFNHGFKELEHYQILDERFRTADETHFNPQFFASILSLHLLRS